ncbi:asparaginase [Xenorhabdus beddingii]|uniref:Asparaginase n=1 Tax=Xenorhabdus beddingii TaxID=40578 RepID=A0A1Y2SQR3_9GAMM|nr:amino acid--tRNA ligase-related protein [Xenorhabdus beddingii]OTA21343.1 asparaginase [Xenorhabdus beddingii]
MSKPTLSYLETYIWSGLVLNGLRKAAAENNFMEILPSIISSSYEPGAKHSFAVLGDKNLPQVISDESGNVQVKGKEKYYLPVSHVVEKQMSLEFLEKVYCVAPCLRLVMDGEESSGKHLYNFFQFEIEWRTSSMEDVFLQGEKILVSLAKTILEDQITPQSETGLRNIRALAKSNYPTITFSEGHRLIGNSPDLRRDFTPEEDEKLTKLFDIPFWIYDYPEGVRDSIYHQNDEGSYDTYDLMLPFGYGELTTGGIRPKTAEEILQQSKRLGKSYSTAYAEWKDRSQIQTAGFGIGLERIIRYMSGCDSILDIVQYHDLGPNRNINKDFFKEKEAI